MRSNARSERLDLASGLPTTTEDTEALRRVRALAPLDLEAYLRFLEQLPPRTHDELRSKPGPRADRSFVIARTARAG